MRKAGFSEGASAVTFAILGKPDPASPAAVGQRCALFLGGPAQEIQWAM